MIYPSEWEPADASQAWLDELVAMDLAQERYPSAAMLRLRAAFEKRERIMTAGATMRVEIEPVGPRVVMARERGEDGRWTDGTR